MNIDYTVFTKPWRDKSLGELGKFVRELGFTGVELPVRPGFQVEPENVVHDLPEAARILREEGVKIGTLAGPTDEKTIAACETAGVPIIRICAVLDQAHCGLNGEPPEYSIDIVWPYLKVMNLKSAYWRRVNVPDAECAEWRSYWTTGRHGLAHWPRVAPELKKRNFSGDLCLTAEYSDHDAVDRLIAENIAFAKSLFGEAQWLSAKTVGGPHAVDRLRPDYASRPALRRKKVLDGTARNEPAEWAISVPPHSNRRGLKQIFLPWRSPARAKRDHSLSQDTEKTVESVEKIVSEGIERTDNKRGRLLDIRVVTTDWCEKCAKTSIMEFSFQPSMSLPASRDVLLFLFAHAAQRDCGFAAPGNPWSVLRRVIVR